MTSIRRAIATFSLVAILSTFVVSTAVAFNDVPADGSELSTAVAALVANGSVTAGDTFGPAAPLTRGEAVKYLVKSAGGYTMEDPATPSFADVAKGTPYYTFVETAYKNGIVGGKTVTATAKYFAPNDTVTRAEFAKMAVLAFELPKYNPTTAKFNDVPNTGVEYPYVFVETAAKYGVVNGMTVTPPTFAPAATIIKSQGALMSYRATQVDMTEDEEEEEDTSADFDENGTTEGSVIDVSLGSRDETEALEGQTDIEIYAVDLELDDEGPLQLQRADVWFAQDIPTSSSKPWEYFTEVSLTVDGEVVATVDTSDSSAWGTKDNGEITDTDVDGAGADLANDTAAEYRLRFTGLEETLIADETTKIGLQVSVVDNLDSADEDAVWWTELSEVRIMDETAYVTTIDSTDTLGDMGDLEENFAMSPEDEASLDVRTAEDEVEASVIEVSTSADKEGVEIYAFEIEEDNGVDVNITELEMTFLAETSTGADDVTETDVVKTAYLYQDGEEVGSETMTSSGDVVFDGLDIDVGADSTETFTVVVDLKDNNDGVRYDEGTLLSVDVTNLSEFSDAHDNDQDDITETVDATSEAHELRSEGVAFTFVSATEDETFTADAEDEADQGTYKVTFKAKAFGADMRLDKSCEESGADAAGQGVEYTITNSASNSTVCNLTSTTTDATEDTANTFELDKGVERTFTLTVVATASATHFAEVSIASLNWGTATDDTNANYYTFNLDNFKTDALSLTLINNTP